MKIFSVLLSCRKLGLSFNLPKFLSRLFRNKLLLPLAAPLLFFMIFIMVPSASAHALPVQTTPADNSVLSIPPSQVRIEFSEPLNPLVSKIVVVDPSNREIDKKDSYVASNDPNEMVVDMQLVPPGTYVVVWRSVSMEDGHIAGGSFLFHVARPDGTVPPLNGPLPSGNIPGGAGISTGSNSLTWPNVLNLISIWVMLIATIYWVGGVIWQRWILPDNIPDNEPEAIPNEKMYGLTSQYFNKYLIAARTRFYRTGITALVVAFVANLGVIASQAISLAGNSIQGLYSLPLLNAIILNSDFGTFWAARQIIILVVLLFLIFIKPSFEEKLPISYPILAVALLLAVALSGHAASVAVNTRLFSIGNDWIHLAAASIWIGALFYIVDVVIPMARCHQLDEQLPILLYLFPRYSPFAFTGIALLAITGPINTDFHLTSLSQFVTTEYGLALLVKLILIALILICGSIHVFFTRPRLKKKYKKITRSTKQLYTQMMFFIHSEAVLGCGVLLCVAAMSIFASTLVQGTGSNSYINATSSGPVTLHQSADGYNATLYVTPDKFGNNTFKVTVTTSNGQAITDGQVYIETTMLDMDMGTQTVNLQPDGKGNYSNSGELAMGGHWEITAVLRTRTDPSNLHRFDFKFIAGY